MSTIFLVKCECLNELDALLNIGEVQIQSYYLWDSSCYFCRTESGGPVEVADLDYVYAVVEVEIEEDHAHIYLQDIIEKDDSSGTVVTFSEFVDIVDETKFNPQNSQDYEKNLNLKVEEEKKDVVMLQDLLIKSKTSQIKILEESLKRYEKLVKVLEDIIKKQERVANLYEGEIAYYKEMVQILTQG